MSYTIQDFGPSDLLTSDRIGVRRVKVDSQQQSLEALTQFQYIDRIVDVPFSNQIVYYVQLTNPLYLFKRVLDLLTGGREYLAYPDTGTHTFTGTLADSGYIGPVSTIPNPDVPVVPVTGVTIQRAVGVDIFTPDPAVSFTAMGLSVSAGNVNQSVNNYVADSDVIGIRGGVAFWLIMNPVGGNNPVRGQFTLKWEEVFE